MKKILVVSYGDDSHKNCFLEASRGSNYEIIVFDAGGYPLSDDEISINYHTVMPSLSFRISGQIVSTEDIIGVWWRRPRGARSVVGSAINQYTNLEGEVIVRSLSYFLQKANWVSDPEATRTACRKPVQLAIAKGLGLKIPDTCISNSPDEIKAFIARLHDKPIIMKPAGTSFVDLTKDGKGQISKVIFTKIIKPELILENIDLTRNCPVIFQEAVQKDSDVRITVVDDEVFCAEITLEGCSDPSNVDWRNHDGVRKYKKHSLPQDIAQLCVNLPKVRGLWFVLINMPYSLKDGYTFFEINPQGQWLPSENLGYQISNSLLRALSR
jgi:glutathione synthase/RimK-type ligase-like ATP-grasp enzyme